MTRMMLGGLAAALIATTATVGAKDAMKTMEKSYTGCLERTSNGGYTLTHAMAAGTMADKPMKKDAMKDSMKDNTMHDMKDGSMSTDSMMKKDSMASDALTLSSSSVDLSKHVGHKVSVKGVEDQMNGMTSVTVKSLKMVGTSCS